MEKNKGQISISDDQLLKNKKLLTPAEVAVILRISKRKVYYLCSMSQLEELKITNNIRIKTHSVIELLNKDDDTTSK